MVPICPINVLNAKNEGRLLGIIGGKEQEEERMELNPNSQTAGTEALGKDTAELHLWGVSEPCKSFQGVWMLTATSWEEVRELVLGS